MSKIETLTMEEVIWIHERLTADALASDDPISPPGVKDMGLLESAIYRQRAGYGSFLKYDTPISNAASLCFGICNNHALHNGNKRTALVSLICHLDKNGYTFTDRASQQSLYSFMLRVAGHQLLTKKRKGKAIADDEVKAMTEWLAKKTRKVQKGEKSISYNELERVLKEHDVYFENHKSNYVDVVKYSNISRRKGIFGKKETVRVGEKVAHIPYWPGRPVGKGLVKSIRRQAGLTHEHGVDSTLFYGNETLPDEFIQRYKKVLRKLAKT
ncbi:type II toxin-antitoxin system death-on-curing family toxin [Pseudidiomarina sp. 1APP75-32.1]|uniref:Type II toxin-antitoxin system death-on-curing family toxin n=1 Tax=Pseudidiomarina terrestris TaxID=2820060 RepID=A0AAW7R3I3_9GAMM|nr:type II toxin-antitoxin system death-on-curing family toxin [Pseudidiomarina sp. 1APP75-32.1]MDN7125059.1 type II toxin-antitoxin system death-on-curing family toxin [Pseudidiomarina sp. 1APP75-32.1]